MYRKIPLLVSELTVTFSSCNLTLSLRSRRYSRARENGKLEIPPAQKRHILSSAHRMVPPSLLRSLFAGPRFSPHVQAAYCSNTFHSNCLANHSLSTRIRNYSRQNLLIPKQRWRRMIKHCVKSPIISYFYFQRSSKECDSNNN